MKILQVINSLDYGGAEKLVVEMAILLKKTNFDVEVLLIHRSKSDYEKRLQELEKFVNEINLDNIKVMPGRYQPEEFFEMSKGLEQEKERGKRCYQCYKLRLEETAKIAEQQNFDFFTTTLSISPYKNSKWLNEIGADLDKKYQSTYLYADFKKKNGYKRSIELSKQYNLYRQDYCGCIYSKKEKELLHNKK